MIRVLRLWLVRFASKTATILSGIRRVIKRWPYDADYIGESNVRHDGERKISKNYSEPWVFLWRRYAEKAMRVLEALGDERRKAIDDCIEVCESVGKNEETGHLLASGADEYLIAIKARFLGPQIK